MSDQTNLSLGNAMRVVVPNASVPGGFVMAPVSGVLDANGVTATANSSSSGGGSPASPVYVNDVPAETSLANIQSNTGNTSTFTQATATNTAATNTALAVVNTHLTNLETNTAATNTALSLITQTPYEIGVYRTGAPAIAIGTVWTITWAGTFGITTSTATSTTTIVADLCTLMSAAITANPLLSPLRTAVAGNYYVIRFTPGVCYPVGATTTSNMSMGIFNSSDQPITFDINQQSWDWSSIINPAYIVFDQVLATNIGVPNPLTPPPTNSNGLLGYLSGLYQRLSTNQASPLWTEPIGVYNSSPISLGAGTSSNLNMDQSGNVKVYEGPSLGRQQWCAYANGSAQSFPISTPTFRNMNFVTAGVLGSTTYYTVPAGYFLHIESIVIDVLSTAQTPILWYVVALYAGGVPVAGSQGVWQALTEGAASTIDHVRAQLGYSLELPAGATLGLSSVNTLAASTTTWSATLSGYLYK